MATYRFSAKLISRADGRSSVAAAAYRAGERLIDERTGEVANFSGRGDVLDREILAPANAPDWVSDRERLWNTVEGAEKRRDAQVAREIQVSLPHELSLEANRELLHAFAHEQFVARGMVADIAIHAAHRGGDDRNVHAHVLLTTRPILADGFGAKAREWNDRSLLANWRVEWERHVNLALERERSTERVDHRSYVARGIDREAEPKQGPIATQMERQGRRSHAGHDRREAQKRNAERDRLHAEERELTRQAREEQRRRDLERATEEDRRVAGRDRAAERATHATKAESSTQRAPGIEHPQTPQWQVQRERALSAAYERDMRGTALARFWRIERTADGLTFENARGRFVDLGERLVARDGNDVELAGMLDAAAAKGWRELRFTGGTDFKRHAMIAALERGFYVRADEHDRWILDEIEKSGSPQRQTPTPIDKLVDRLRHKEQAQPEHMSGLDELVRQKRESLDQREPEQDDDRGDR